MIRILLKKMKNRFSKSQSNVVVERPMTENVLLHHEISQQKKELIDFIKTLEKL